MRNNLFEEIKWAPTGPEVTLSGPRMINCERAGGHAVTHLAHAHMHRLGPASDASPQALWRATSAPGPT